MARTAILAIKIISDASGAGKGVDAAADSVGRLQAGAAKAQRAAGVVLTALAGIGAAAAKEASNLQQAAGAVESVFGKQAGAVMGLAKNAAQAVGLAESEYASMASVLGAQLKNLGVAQAALVPTTDKLITTGADLAATYGGTTADAVEALTAAFRGETDPIEKYGISLKQADVAAELAAKGQTKLTGSAKKSAETQARMAIIMRQSADAQGQFAREADTAAGAQARATAETKNALAQLGSVLLPIIAQAATGLASVARYVSQNARLFQVLAGVIGGVAAAVFAVSTALKVYQAAQAAISIATKAAAAAQWLLNVAMSANPIGIIIIAVIALVAGLVLLYKKSETFRNIVQAAGRAAVTAFKAVVGAVKIAWSWVGAKMSSAARAMGNAVAWAGNLIKSVMSAVRTVINAVRSAFSSAGSTARSAFNAVANVIRTVINVNKQLASIIRGTVAAAFRTLASVAKSAMSAISSAVRAVVGVARSVASAIASAFRSAFSKIAGFARSAANAAMSPFRALQSLISSILGAISRIHFPSPPSWLNKAIKGPTVAATSSSSRLMAAGGGMTAAGLMARSGPALYAATPTTRAAPSGVTINISGALDPERTARQITTLLGGATRRRHGIVRPLRAGAA